MRIWKKPISVEVLTAAAPKGMAIARGGIKFVETGDDFIRARQVEVSSEAGELTCVSRIAMAVQQPR